MKEVDSVGRVKSEKQCLTSLRGLAREPREGKAILFQQEVIRMLWRAGVDDNREGLSPINADQEVGWAAPEGASCSSRWNPRRHESRASRIGWDLDPNGLQPSKSL